MSVEVSVRAVNSQWTTIYTFDKLSNLTFGNLKNVVQLSNPNFQKHRQIFVYMGCVVNSDETLVYDSLNDSDTVSIELDLFVFKYDLALPNKHFNWKIDDLSILAAKKYSASKSSSTGEFGCAWVDMKLLLDIVADEYLQGPLSSTSTESSTAISPPLEGLAAAPAPAAPLAPPVPAAAVVPPPQLPVVEWLQWGVLARLILVAFLFTYNRNLSTKKLAHMAGMTLFSYLFQIGALGYFLAWACHAMGFNFNPPVEPIPPVADPAAPAPPVDGGAGGAGGAEGAVAGAAEGVDGELNADANVHNGEERAPRAAPAPATGAAAAPAARAPPAPLNAVQYLNMLYHNGFTIPTAPGILLDVVSLFMGLFLSIVPSWAPYRLHR